METTLPETTVRQREASQPKPRYIVWFSEIGIDDVPLTLPRAGRENTRVNSQQEYRCFASVLAVVMEFPPQNWLWK